METPKGFWMLCGSFYGPGVLVELPREGNEGVMRQVVADFDKAAELGKILGSCGG